MQPEIKGFMIDETRRNLNKATAELIESFITFDKNKVMQLKVGLHAIHNAQKNKQASDKTNLYSVCDYKTLHNLLEEHGIPLHEFDKLPSLAENGNTGNIESFSGHIKEALENISNTVPISGVPTTGMIAVMFNMVSEKAKNALVAGQAGERTLKAIERAANISHPCGIKASALQDTLYDYGSKRKQARPYIGAANEPDYLVSAKATHHLADLLESSLNLHPEARNLESTGQSMIGFNKLAACIFMHAADNLNMAKIPDAAEKIKALASHVENNGLERITDDVFDAVAKGMKTIKELLHKANIITAEESEDYEELVNKRIMQIKKMEMVAAD